MENQHRGHRQFLLTRADIEASAGVDKIHILNAGARRRDLSLGDRTGLAHIGVHRIEVEPGFASTELHVHRFEEECIYVLAGEATLTLDNEQFQVGAGDFIACPANGPAHKLVNSGSVTLVCLVVGQRLDFDVVDYPERGKRLYRHHRERDLVDHAAIADTKGNRKI